MSSNLIIKDNGFVTGDALLNPIAYAGEMNSRFINIVHPTFDNCFYTLLAIKNGYPYTLGIEDGKVMLPPSLINTETKLQCQFIATRKNNEINVALGACNCFMGTSDDCTTMIFKSDEFTLNVAKGLNLNGLNPIPPYEQLVDIYNNISNAKLEVEKAKVENEEILNKIEEKIEELQKLKNK